MTLESYSWDSMLRITNVKLKLIKDIEMYTFIESAMRGMYTHYVSMSIYKKNFLQVVLVA